MLIGCILRTAVNSTYVQESDADDEDGNLWGAIMGGD